MLQKGDKIGIVCCSNGQKKVYQDKTEQLKERLLAIGLRPILSPFIYEKESVAAGTAEERADALMNFYKDEAIKAIFDISGGDIANEVLPYLDFDKIAEAGKEFWGYSDLTTIINAIYAQTQKSSVLFQVRNFIYQDGAIRISEFEKYIFEGKPDLFDFPYHFVRGTQLEGIVVGGNIRCLLKLAGTEYFPNMTDKVLLLEAMSGEMPQIVTYLSQLQQMGVFDKIRGVVLGTFTKYEENRNASPIEELVMRYVPGHMPIVKTDYIGHGTDSKAIMIGRVISL